MWFLVPRIGSLLIAIGYVVALICHQHGLDVVELELCGALLVPLALIWFPEPLGEYLGYGGRGGMIDVETPPALVAFMGWLFLIGFPVFFYLWWGPAK